MKVKMQMFICAHYIYIYIYIIHTHTHTHTHTTYITNGAKLLLKI